MGNGRFSDWLLDTRLTGGETDPLTYLFAYSNGLTLASDHVTD